MPLKGNKQTSPAAVQFRKLVFKKDEDKVHADYEGTGSYGGGGDGDGAK